jgi:hypothetical protein
MTTEEKKEKHRESSKRWREQNRERMKECQRRWRKKNKKRLKEDKKTWLEKNRERVKKTDRLCKMKRIYGLTEEGFNSLLEVQQGCCAICGCAEPKGKGNWHVDHNHETGEVRGLLCSQCNPGLGKFKDSPSILRAGADYIENPTTKKFPGILDIIGPSV